MDILIKNMPQEATERLADQATRLLVWFEASLALGVSAKGIGVCIQSPSREELFMLILTIGFTLWLVSKAVQVERAYLEGTRD